MGEASHILAMGVSFVVCMYVVQAENEGRIDGETENSSLSCSLLRHRKAHVSRTSAPARAPSVRNVKVRAARHQQQQSASTSQIVDSDTEIALTVAVAQSAPVENMPVHS